MSAPTEENKKPAGIESFLIVAYRSLRGSKQTSAFGCPKDILNASPEKIEEMKQKACFVQVEFDPAILTQKALKSRSRPTDDTTMLFYTSYRNQKINNSASFRVFKPPSNYSLKNLMNLNIRDSFYIHKGGFSGLTVIIYDCSSKEA